MLPEPRFRLRRQAFLGPCKAGQEAKELITYGSMAEALYRKYRPKTFADVTQQGHIVKTITNQLATDKVTHAYLFAGPRGVGKTTIARLLAKALNCEQRPAGSFEPCNACGNCTDANAGRFLDMVEIDAASQTKVEETRENIIENVRFGPSRGKYKVFIIDEVHMLSTSSFNALLKTLEEPKSHAVFILATTELHKIPATIISRCQRFDFHRIPAPQMIDRLRIISTTEGVEVDNDVLAAIARLSEGCLRDAESLLGQVMALGEKHITLDIATLIIPATHTDVVCRVSDALTKRDGPTALSVIHEFVEEGGSVPHLVDELMEFSRAMLLCAMSGAIDDRYDLETQAKLKEFAARLSPADHQNLLDQILSARGRQTPSQFPQLPLEIAIAKFCYETTKQTSTPPEPPKPPPAGGVVSTSLPPLRVEKFKLDLPPPAAAPRMEAVIQSGDVYIATEDDLNEVKNKWGRCVAIVGEKNVAFPLILTKADFLRVDNGVIVVALQYAIQVAKMNEMKNLRLIEDAVEQVTQRKLRFSFIHTQSQADEAVADIIEVFGGAVV